MLIGIDANEANVGQKVGVNYYAYNLLHALYRLRSTHRFVIYLKARPRPDLPSPKSGWNYRIIPFPKLWTQTRLPWDLYIHRPRPEVFLSLTHYAPRWSPIPTVIAIMDLGFRLFPKQFTPKDLHQLKSWTAYSVKKAAKILAISENTKQDIIRLYGRRPDDIAVTYLSHDKTLFKPTSDPTVLTKYGIRKPYILFLSSLKPSKNVAGLIQAFSQLPDQKYQLVIAGKKAWMYESIFSRVQKLNLVDRVVFTGYVTSAESPVLMSMAEVFVLPSFYEGFALPALEAMACGTPVVVSRVANLPEIAGKAVIYVDPHDPRSIADGIQAALGPGRERLVKLGLAQAGRFDWQITAQQTLRVLESVKVVK